MLGQFGGKMRFSCAGLACYSSFKWLKSSLLAELFLYCLNVGSQTALAVPLEVSGVFITRCVLIVGCCVLGHENATGLGFDV